MELFHGKFYYCNDESKRTESECVGNMVFLHLDHSEIIEREWNRHDFHFDNVFDAFLSLYTFSTGAGWPDGMWASIETTTKDRGPQPGNRYDFSIYYIVYTIIFPFFFVNVFIAFVILTFQGEGDAQLELECSLEKNEQICLEYAINSKPINKYMPKDSKSFQYKCWKIITNVYFDNFILSLICLNTVTLMLKYYEMSPAFERFLAITNVVFTTMFR